MRGGGQHSPHILPSHRVISHYRFGGNPGEEVLVGLFRLPREKTEQGRYHPVPPQEMDNEELIVRVWGNEERSIHVGFLCQTKQAETLVAAKYHHMRCTSGFVVCRLVLQETQTISQTRAVVERNHESR
jgi:hypothetical protein